MQSDTVDQSRTVVVSGVPDVLPVNRMRDKLIIHFQRCRRSHGGDVEVARYPTDIHGVALVTFDSRKDAERVLRKEEQIMSDEEFPADYALTVFPFSMDVFLYVSSASVDLSVFSGDQTSLIQSLQSSHRSLRFRPSPKQRKVTIQGPFAAVQALRRDLIRRASGLKPTESAQTSQETPLNPRVISHPEFVDTVSCSRSKAKPALVNGLSTGLQTTGEATRVLNTKTVNASLRLEVQERGFAEGRFSDTDGDEEEEEEEESFLTRMGLLLKRLEEEKNLKLTSANEINKTQKQEMRKETQMSSGAALKLDEIRHKDTEKKPKETCTWVDLNAFLYIKKFAEKELRDCLGGLNASFESIQGSELVRVTLTEASEATSGIQQALEGLQALVELWMTTLRVHEINFDDGLEREVLKICNETQVYYSDVLWTLEGSRIKIIGPSLSSHLFYKSTERKMSTLKRSDVM